MNIRTRLAVCVGLLLGTTPLVAQQPSTPVQESLSAALPSSTAQPSSTALLAEGSTLSRYGESNVGGLASIAAPQAVEHSDAYYTRLKIHRIGSYAILPLFAAQYYLGSKLIDGTSDSGVKSKHQAVAFTIGGVFVVNTVTGVWNLIESRNEKEGRGRRILHAALMAAADAGFVYTGTLADGASDLNDGADRHRNAALTSVGLATVGTLVMWLR